MSFSRFYSIIKSELHFHNLLKATFLNKFKQEIKEELNNPEENNKKKTKNVEKNNDVNHSEEFTNKLEIQIRNNNLVKDSFNEVYMMETSRFGKSKVETPANDYYDQGVHSKNISPIPMKGVISTISDYERKSNLDGTLSLSYIKKQDDDSNYIVYDSGHGSNIANNSHKYGKNTQHRIQKYQSEDNSDHDSSRPYGTSRNSRGSFRIEYLMSKAFTPIVPANNHLNEISRITWNRNDLFDNITYSNITDSILMGRNTFIPYIGKNNTDNVVKKRKSLICDSNESVKVEDPAFKSPDNEGKVKYSLNYHRSLSNEQNSFTNGNKVSVFPPVESQNKAQLDMLKEVKPSRRNLNARNMSRSKKQQSIVSQKSNFEADRLNKSFVTSDSKIKLEESEYESFRKKSKILISKDQIYNSNLESFASNKRKELVSNTSEKIQDIIVSQVRSEDV